MLLGIVTAFVNAHAPGVNLIVADFEPMTLRAAFTQASVLVEPLP